MPVGVLLNFNAMVHFKNKLQLKFRNNKNFSNVTVIIYKAYAKKKTWN